MYVIMSLEIAKGFQLALSEKVSKLASASGMTRIFKLGVCRRGTAAKRGSYSTSGARNTARI